jgi:hypothetical protein
MVGRAVLISGGYCPVLISGGYCPVLISGGYTGTLFGCATLYARDTIGLV